MLDWTRPSVCHHWLPPPAAGAAADSSRCTVNWDHRTERLQRFCLPPEYHHPKTVHLVMKTTTIFTILLTKLHSDYTNLGLKKEIVCFLQQSKKNRVGRSVNFLFFALFFWSKMCVLCMFYIDWELGGRKKL